MTAHKRVKNSLLNAYACPHCGAWHLGRSNDPARRANRITEALVQYEAKMASKVRQRKSNDH